MTFLSFVIMVYVAVGLEYALFRYMQNDPTQIKWQKEFLGIYYLTALLLAVVDYYLAGR
jgi:hypothetical protein